MEFLSSQGVVKKRKNDLYCRFPHKTLLFLSGSSTSGRSCNVCLSPSLRLFFFLCFCVSSPLCLSFSFLFSFSSQAPSSLVGDMNYSPSYSSTLHSCLFLFFFFMFDLYFLLSLSFPVRTCTFVGCVKACLSTCRCCPFFFFSRTSVVRIASVPAVDFRCAFVFFCCGRGPLSS